MNKITVRIVVLFAVLAVSIQLQAQTQSPQKALSFDGVDDYVSGTTGISTSLTAITIEAWVYHNTLPTNVIQRYVTIQPEVAVLRYDGSGLGGTNELHFYIKKSNGSIYSLRVDNVLTTGTWMHIAGTYDGTVMELYLNGNRIGSASPAGGLYPPTGDFKFSSGSEAFNGKIDEVSVWNYARAMADIREDMYRTAPIANANLINYWQFNDGFSITLTDIKGGATGTLYNMDNYQANWIASTIPFAAGAVNTQIVNATGTKTFTGTGLAMNFTAKSSTDTIVASRIDTLANVSPTGVTTAFNSQYWAINRFGTGTFTSNLTFTVNEDITSAQAAHPNLIKLYKRSGNGDGTWTLVATAASADDVNNTATFNGLTSFDGQYMVCFSTPPNTVGTALNFDGINDYVDCGNAASLNITGSITIEAWIYADTWKTNSWDCTIVGKDSTSPAGYVLRCGSNGKLSFNIGTNGVFTPEPLWKELISESVMQAGQWNCVAGVYDGTTMFIYINGVLCDQQWVGASIRVSPRSLFIGNSPGNPSRFFDGKIDEVRLYNVAKTEAEIRSDMYNTLTGTETGLVHYWQFNNSSGTTLTDVIGSSNGTLTNMDAATCWVESYAMVVPAPGAASYIINTAFTANWTAPAIGSVTSYKLDVSTNNTFTSLVSGYNNLDCGSNLSKAVTGLTSGTTYYYRVRANKTSVTGTGANYYTYTTAATTAPHAGKYAGGAGTSDNPYQIATLDDLFELSDSSVDWNPGQYFIQTADIDAIYSNELNSGAGFSPIGNNVTNFTGNYNGQDHTISNVYINRPTTDNVGFWGLAVGDSIKNLTLTNVNIKGQNNVGGVIGNNQGALIKCSATGSVNATGNNAGGLAGYSTGNEEYSFSKASVTANGNNAGGLFGTKAGGLANQCYATGAVSSGLNTKGGIAGAVGTGADIENSYWDTWTTGQNLGYNTNAGIFNAWGKTTTLMIDKSTYAGWNFAKESTDASNEYWYMLTDETRDYPAHFYASEPKTNAATNIGSDIARLNWSITDLGTPASTYHGVCWNATGSPTLADSKSEFASPTVASFSANATNLIPNTTYYFRAYTRSAVDAKYGAVLSFTTFNGTKPAGDGSAANPFRIANIRNLQYLSTTPGLWNQGYTFIQTANINAAETRNWDGGQGFIPIGNQSVNFNGNYHGKGNSIDSLYINRPGSDRVGFFGDISSTDGTLSIDSLGLTNVYITGSSNVGGLVGDASSFHISHCRVTGGSVTATNSGYYAGVGGMVGTVIRSGDHNNNTFSHCFAAVAVSGQDEVGGFVGQTYGGYINQCYSAGPVSGNAGGYVGGFVGYRMCLGSVYSLDSSYYDIQASGQATGAGRNDYPAYNHLQGKTTAEMKTQATYEGWDFSTDWKISGSVNNGYPYFDYPATQISTAPVSNIANNTATATGSINHIGTLPIAAHGFCWNTTGTPTLVDAKVNLGATTTSADYSASINSFNHNTTYYLRAYVINTQDTLYGNVVNFTTTNTPMGVTCMTFSQAIVDIGVSSNRIRIPDNNTLDLTNNYSIEAWINPANRDVISGDCMLIHKGLFTGGPIKGYYLERTTTGNNLGLIFDDMVTADNILTPNTWNHIAAVNDNGTRHIYVNGVEYPLTGTPKTVIENSEPLIIGSGNKAGSYKPFYGKFDEISLWNTALSQSQIREHMHFPLAGTETGLVSYWQFDEGSEGTVSDKMGINNGTIVNGGATYNDDYVVAPDPSPFWLVSTTPFGMGNSNTQVVTATGTNTFTNTGLAMNFTAKTGMDSIVVARIDAFPNINPTGLETVFDNQYWAVHKYGNGTFNADLTFTLSEDLTTSDENNPGNIALYTRGSMTDTNWVVLDSAASVNAATNQATFNGITGFSQFIIARTQAVPSTPVLSLPANGSTGTALTPTLTWNAATGAVSYTVQVSTDSANFTSPVVNQAGLTALTYDITSGLANDIRYYWRVNATNAGGTSAWATIWDFTTDSNVPVTLSSFTAQSVGQGILLSWATQSEQNNLGWNVLRSTSIDSNFTQVNSELIAGAGSTSLPQMYSFADLDATAGTWYYQLEQVDVNGNRGYSSVVTATVITTGIQIGTQSTIPDVKARPTVLYNMQGAIVPLSSIKPGIYFTQQHGVWNKVLVTE